MPKNLLDILPTGPDQGHPALESKAKRDQAFEKINDPCSPVAPDQPWAPGLNYLQNKNDTMTNTGATGFRDPDQSIYRRSNWSTWI